MVRILIAIAAGLAVIAAGGCAREADAETARQTRTPAVLVASADDFVPGADRDLREPDGLPAPIAAAIAGALAETGRVRVIEREALRRIVDEQRVSAGGSPSRFDESVLAAMEGLDQLEDMTLGSAATFEAVSAAAFEADVLNAMADVGAAAGADLMLYGDFETQSRSRSAQVPGAGRTRTIEETRGVLTIRLIDVRDGVVMGARRITVIESGRQEPLEDRIGRRAAAFVIDTLTPPALVSLDPPVVNRGASQGWARGDVVEILREGEVIRDTNGAVLGSLLEPVAIGELVSVQDEISTIALPGPLSPAPSYRVRRAGEGPAAAARGGTPESGARLQSGAGGQGFALAVGPIEAPADLPDGVVPLLRDELEIALNDLGRFDLIDRRRLGRVIEELDFQDFVSGRPVGGGLTGLAGADYLVLGRLDEFASRTSNERVAALGRTVRTTVAEGEATFQIIDARIGGVAAIERVAVSLEDVTAEELVRALAREAAFSLTNAAFPFEVLAADADGVIVNRGQNWDLSRGMRFEVMRPGGELRGSDGVSFGRRLSPTGEVEIESVGPQTAVARLIDGDAERGDLLRPIRDAEDNQPRGDGIDW